MTDKKLNIAILSDSPFLTTGYRNQAFNIANILGERGHNVYYFAHAYVGQNLKPGIEFEDGSKTKFTVIGSGREQYFFDVIPIYLKQFKIDVFMILLDTFMMYPRLLELDMSPAKSIFYFPSDGGGAMPLGCEQILKHVNVPIAMAKFGQEQVKKVHNIDTRFIPHATNSDLFKPLPEAERQQLKANWGLKDKFVIGVVARNQGRKMLDKTIKIMSVYAKMNPNAVLLMHCDPDDAAQVFPLRSLIERYGIQNRVLFTGTRYYKGMTDKDMNLIYNLFDVFLLTTSGEGFGIPIIEAMSCEVPVIATDYTTTRELVIDNDAGWGIDLVGTTADENEQFHGAEILDGTITGSWSVERGLCSVKDGAIKLDIAFKDVEGRKKKGSNGRKAILETYNWNVTSKKWIETFEELGKW